jgi:hypothetical protein
MRAHVNTATVADNYIYEPTLLLWGVRAWPQVPNPDGSCPVCGRGPRGRSTCCLVCLRCSPDIEAKVRAADIKAKARESAERADKSARDKLLSQTVTKLTECERRRIWNGGVGGVHMEAAEPTNRARIGREFLRSIGQEPDWSIALKFRARSA